MLANLFLPTLAFTAAIVLIIIIIIISTFIRKRGETQLLQLVTILLIVGSTALPAVIRILSGFDVDDPRVAQSAPANILAIVWLKRILTGVLLILTTAGLARRLFARTHQAAPGSGLILGYLSYVTLSLVIGAMFSSEPAFLSALYYPALALSLTFAAKDANLESVMTVTRVGVGVVIAVSLIMAVITPYWAFSRSGQSLIPLVPGRLVGLTSHPNVLGPLGIIYLLLGTVTASHKFSRKLMQILAMLVIILAQSKTIWAASALILMSILLVRVRTSVIFSKSSIAGWSIVALLLGAIATTALVWVAATFGITSLAQVAGIKGIDTVVGRSEIWDITIRLWKANPWFGYGPTLWDPQFRMSYSMPYVGQAHNQIVQTLGDSGLIGLLGLTIYMATLASYAMRFASVSRGLTVGLIILIYTRGLTETPIRSLGIADPTFFIHFTVFLALLYWARVNPINRMPAIFEIQR